MKKYTIKLIQALIFPVFTSLSFLFVTSAISSKLALDIGELK